MDGLILLRPWWLLALLPLAGVVARRLARRPDAGGWEGVMGRDMLRAMRTLGHLGGRQPASQRLLAPGALDRQLYGADPPPGFDARAWLAAFRRG